MPGTTQRLCKNVRRLHMVCRP